MKIFKKIIMLSYPLVLLLIILSFLYEPLNEYTDHIISVFYWLILVGLIVSLRNRKISTKKILKMAFIFSLIGILLSGFNFSLITEFILRLAFIGWLIGIIISVKEYMDDNVK